MGDRYEFAETVTEIYTPVIKLQTNLMDGNNYIEFNEIDFIS